MINRNESTKTVVIHVIQVFSDSVVILLGEITYWSIIGLKGGKKHAIDLVGIDDKPKRIY